MPFHLGHLSERHVRNFQNQLILYTFRLCGRPDHLSGTLVRRRKSLTDDNASIHMRIAAAAKFPRAAFLLLEGNIAPVYVYIFSLVLLIGSYGVLYFLYGVCSSTTTYLGTSKYGDYPRYTLGKRADPISTSRSQVSWNLPADFAAFTFTFKTFVHPLTCTIHTIHHSYPTLFCI